MRDDDTPALGYERPTAVPGAAGAKDGRGMWAEWSKDTRDRAPRAQQDAADSAGDATRAMPNRGRHLPSSSDAEKTQIMRERREP